MSSWLPSFSWPGFYPIADIINNSFRLVNPNFAIETRARQCRMICVTKKNYAVEMIVTGNYDGAGLWAVFFESRPRGLYRGSSERPRRMIMSGTGQTWNG
jgi:hypothetical protein